MEYTDFVLFIVDMLYIKQQQIRIFRSLRNVERVEVLPYHTLGVYKWKALGYDYPLEGIEPPTKERVKNAEMILNGEKTRD